MSALTDAKLGSLCLKFVSRCRLSISHLEHRNSQWSQSSTSFIPHSLRTQPLFYLRTPFHLPVSIKEPIRPLTSSGFSYGSSPPIKTIHIHRVQNTNPVTPFDVYYLHTMMSVKVGKWWCSSSYLHGRYGGCYFWLTAVWLCAIKESALQQAQQVRWKHINMMRTHESDVQHWQSHGCIVYHKRPSMRLPTHTSTNSSHLIITHGTAILSNQDIHQVRVPFTVSQQNRCLTSLHAGSGDIDSGRWLDARTDHYTML